MNYHNMKHWICRLVLVVLPGLVLTACTDAWDQHYRPQEPTSSSLTVYKGSAASFIKSEGNLGTIDALFEKAGIYAKMQKGQRYTLVVYPNAVLDASPYASDSQYAAFCVSDIAFSPAQFHDGMALKTWQGKSIRVTLVQGEPCFSGKAAAKSVYCDDAYVYVIEDGVIPISQSVYEAIMSLDDAQYSLFKRYIRRYERRYFDASRCTPIGTNAQGNTVYADSANGWVVENYLMDRYTSEGQEIWNMRDESYYSTVFVPSNDLINAAIDTALTRVPRWLGRTATAADRQKYETWFVRACFVDRLLTPEEVSGINDIDCVGGYTRDTVEGTKFSAADQAMWRPTVQKVRTADRIEAANGNLYFVDWVKVPNNVIIYRLKSRFYELWNNMTADQRNRYFRWDHWIDPMIINDAQGSFTLSETLPTMYYHVLTAIPDKEARKDSLVCSVTYDGVLYNPSNPRGSQIAECCIPAGEYYLRMGFKHSLMYSLSIQFCDTLVVRDMVMYAQGSNFHFDRGSVAVVDNYGESSIGYPEGYNWHDWSSLSEKAQAYDTDGFQVAVVNMKEEGNFTITVSSSDMSRLYTYGADRNTSNIYQLMMYHWCLRPTKNNY